jgi:hypothetical protein
MATEINTNEYIQKINDAYNAGVENNNEQKNTIISDVYRNLPNDCKNYTRVLDSKYTSSVYSGTLYGSIFSNYKNDVESANSISSKILTDERDYFTKKYSEKVYDYLLNQRQKIYDIKNSILSTIDFNNIESSDTTITINEQTYSIDNLVQNILKSNNDTKNQTMNYLYDKFSKYLPSANSELLNRKIQYRDMEHDKLKWVNHILNFVYYSLLIVLFVILYSADNLYFKERFLLYIFLILAPMIFPFIYDLIKKIFNLFSPTPGIHGPKNAFLDTTVNKPIIYGHNI